MENIESLYITEDASLREALAQLDRSGQRILLVIDVKHRLVRTLSDGDIRRMLLDDANLENTTLKSLPFKKPIVMKENATATDALALMDRSDVDHIPIVDDKYKILDLIQRRDISGDILLSTPHLGEYEAKYVEEAFKTNWIAPLGPNVNAFEQELADYVGVRAAAAVNSGTAALHLAIRLLDVGPGDIVFCSTFTFVASANPILYEHAIPVFIDSEPRSWNMSPAALKRAFIEAEKNHQLPKAVIVANIYGQSSDFDPIIEICDEYNVPIIEDAAESLGATYKNKSSGTLGKLGVFSFNGNKIITTSGGGMLISDDDALIERARFLATQAREPVSHYEHIELGYNYRMSNVLAGIGRGQLRVLDDRIAARRLVYARYQEKLEGIESIRWMPECEYGRSNRWLSVLVLVPEFTSISVDEFIQQLAQHNIEARHVWKPLHTQGLFANSKYFPFKDDYNLSEELFAYGVCLPSGSNLTTDDQQRVINAIQEIIK